MINVKVDMREFNAALKQAILTSSRSAAQVVNSQAWRLADRSLKATKRADADKIAHVLGQVGNKTVRKRKTGKLGKGARIFGGDILKGKRGAPDRIAGNPDTFARRIILKRAKAKGGWKGTEEELQKAVRNLINARIKSVGFLASGWIWSIADIARQGGWDKGAKVPTKHQNPKGSRQGFGVGANPRAKHPSAKIVNTASQKRSKTTGEAVVMDGLRIGIAESVADMSRHLESKLKKDLRKYSTR